MKKIFSFILILALTLSSVSATTPYSAVDKTAQYVLSTTPNPQVSTVGGEWAMIGLARSNSIIPHSFLDSYAQAIAGTVAGNQGILHDRKYTEYSRVILALTAIGANPTDVAGYNLLTPLGDYEKTIWQGVNGAIWALIALDSAGYDIPTNKDAITQATRTLYLEHILDCVLPTGGWSLQHNAIEADPDLTAMALQALVPYRDDSAVSAVIDDAIAVLSQSQNSTGGFTSFNEDNLESSAQVLVSLCTLGISTNDARFVKNGHSLLDFLLSHQLADGSFARTVGGATDQMASEQGLYALVAVDRMMRGQNSLYQMDDVTIQTAPPSSDGLPNKHEAVQKRPIINPTATFADIAGNPNATAIEALAARGFLAGKGNGLFVPKDTMNRAEFATLIVSALGLPTAQTTKFVDIAPSAWYAPYVGTALQFGIVAGIDDSHFNPSATISRQEAATMVAQAAKLCGLNQTLSTTAIRNLLAGFVDYVTVAPWAQYSVALCYSTGILDDSTIKISPQTPVTRDEVAQMVYNLLGVAQLQ